jgi:ribosomal 50S subunit-recycling heat shock protein
LEVQLVESAVILASVVLLFCVHLFSSEPILFARQWVRFQSNSQALRLSGVDMFPMFVVGLCILLTFAVAQAFSPRSAAPMQPRSWTGHTYTHSTKLHSGKDYELVVPSDAPKVRLDVFLSDALKQHTRSFVANLCDEGLVIVNEKKASKSYKVSKGDIITLSVEDREITSVEPEDIPLDIIYEDEQMIAVNKPVGMVVHPAVGSPNTHNTQHTTHVTHITHITHITYNKYTQHT